jgi:hypothetical protein
MCRPAGGMTTATLKNSGKRRGKVQRQIAPQPASDVAEPSLWPLLQHLLGPVCILICTGIMVSWTWATQPDPLIDTGRELYIPWQITQGKVLYRDIAYFNGPLSPYFNALLFRVFGVHLSVLLWANLVIALAITGMFYCLLLRLSDGVTAMIACCFFVFVFIFNALGTQADFSFIMPYSHEMTHGMLVSLVGLVCLDRFARRPHWLPLGAVALMVGLSWLGKAEFALALTAACGLSLLTWARTRPLSWAALAQRGVMLLVLAMLPALVAALALSRAMPWAEVGRSLAGSWRHVGDPVIGSMPFYRELMGTDHPVGRFLDLLKVAGIYLLMFGPLAGVAMRARTLRQQFLAAAIVVAVLAGLLIGLDGVIQWDAVILPAPIVLPVVIAVVGWRVRRCGDRSQLLPLAICTFALLLLARMLLNARLYRYGFSLAAPATMLLFVLLLHVVPGWIRRRGGAGGVFQVGVLMFLGYAMLSYFLVMVPYFVHSRVEPIAADTGEFWADVRGQRIQLLIKYLDANAAPTDTLAVLPEGATINFLTQRPNPTRYIVALPLEWHLFGGDCVTAAYRDHPPDYIAVIYRDNTDFGATYFGSDYAVDFARWIQANYQPVAWFGSRPTMRPDPDGIVLWWHKS